VKARVVRAPVVVGRPAMNGSPVVFGVEAWTLMTQLLAAQAAIRGEDLVVDRTAVRIIRARKSRVKRLPSGK
jgi:hypothetical protein